MSASFEASCDCGYAGAYSSEAKAAYALRGHSCRRWRAKAAAKRRRLKRLRAVDRTPKLCLHEQANHEHGTHACYVLDRCRCRPCSRANTAYENDRARQKAYGRWNGLVDAEPAREHVRSLVAQGMGPKRIAEVSGVSHGSLTKLLYGVYDSDGNRTREPARRVKPGTAERLLATRLDLAGGAKVDGTGTRRRLRALVALGYSITYLGQQIGVQNVHRTIHGRGDGFVVKATADRTAALYERLSMTLNTSANAGRARTYAKAHGWLPPLAWDDERIDDPSYQPILEHSSITHDAELDEAAIYRRMHGDKTVRLSKADAAETIRRCFDVGWTWTEIEKRAGLKADRYQRGDIT